jgi:predicted ATP-grasp superfamily ATP-dependent carboligase
VSRRWVVSNPLLIVGASGRAAAASAIRAGFEPFVIDLFADADTVRLCPTLKCDPADYPHGFIELTKQAPPGPWMYTGGLENYPDVIAAISEGRELWGNGPEVLKLVRDPWVLDGIPKFFAGFAEVLPRGDSPAGHVRKLLRGSGGFGIRFAQPGDWGGDPLVYFQKFIDGEPQSAIFFAATRGSAPVTLGRTRQLIGTAWLHAHPFQYAGNVSYPWSENPLMGWPFDLCEMSGLRGLFGLDFIHRLIADGNAWQRDVVDVNPRYTASVEPLELAYGVPLLTRTQPPLPASRVVGKAIYYAAVPITFPASGPWDESLRHCTDVWRMPEFADLPHAGSVIEPGQPVFTLFAGAATEAECVNQLRAKAAACDRLFGVPTPEGKP